MILFADLQDAAAWEHRICLDCTATFDKSLERECPVCGGEDTAPAAKVLSLIERIEEFQG